MATAKIRQTECSRTPPSTTSRSCPTSTAILLASHARASPSWATSRASKTVARRFCNLSSASKFRIVNYNMINNFHGWQAAVITKASHFGCGACKAPEGGCTRERPRHLEVHEASPQADDSEGGRRLQRRHCALAPRFKFV